MTWHYLPVYVVHNDERQYSFCEVYLDDDGRVEAWTESREIAPSGNSPEKLSGDLEHMINDLVRWEPVEFSSLSAGMVLRPSNSTHHS